MEQLQCYGPEFALLFILCLSGQQLQRQHCRTYACSISKELYDQIPETDVRKNMFLGPKEGETYTTSTGRASKGALYDRAMKDYADKIYSTSYIFAYMQFKILCADQPGIGQLNNFRSAEMYLIEAEANCHIGGKDAETQKLLIALNKDSGRNPAYTCTKTGDDLLQEVKLYRRIEPGAKVSTGSTTNAGKSRSCAKHIRKAVSMYSLL